MLLPNDSLFNFIKTQVTLQILFVEIDNLYWLTAQFSLDAHRCATRSAESGLIFSKDSKLVLGGLY